MKTKLNPRTEDLTGKRFGRLTVVQFAGYCEFKHGKYARWEVRCDCGCFNLVLAGNLKCGRTNSCGCWAREVATTSNTSHGLSDSPEFRVWAGMIKRCFNKKSINYERYGGRGIGVCERWLKFENFYEDMGTRPIGRHPSGKPMYSLDRINNDGNYSPDNCRWSTAQQQNHNRRPRSK